MYSVARFGETLYLGGDFTEVSAATGAGVVFSPSTAAPVAGFPQVVGRVYAVLSDGAGGWYIGGAFTHVGGLPRSNLARITSNLAVDGWNPGANGTVRALLASNPGLVYVGGEFTTIGGQSRTALAEIAADGSVTAWNPAPVGFVYALALLGTDILVGGDFASVGASPRVNLALVDRTLGVATSFSPAPDGPVYTLEVVTRSSPLPNTTRILVGGSFGTIGGNIRTNLAEISVNGVATHWNPNPNGAVYDIQDLASVHVVGAFTSISGVARNRAAAVHPTTEVATAWNPDCDGVVYALYWTGSRFYVGGGFTTVGGLPRPRLARVDDVTGAAATWIPGPNGTVRAIGVGSGSTVYAGGEFTGLAGVRRNRLAALDLRTGMVTAWNPDVNGAVHSLALSSVGPSLYTVYAGGEFTSVGGTTRFAIAAIDATTGAITSWNPGANGTVSCMLLRPDGLYVGGSFVLIGGASRSRVAALDLGTGLALPWQANVNGDVNAIAFSTDAYIGGSFTTVNGISRNRIASLASADGAPTAWNGNADATVRALVVDGTTLCAGGDFTTMGGQARNRLAALDRSTAALKPWNPGADLNVRSLARGETGLFAGGAFSIIGGQARKKIALLDLGTGAVDPWSADVADGEVFTLLPNGPIVYAGGTFSGIGPLPQARVAAVGHFPPLACTPNALTSSVNPRPTAIATGDFDNDGVLDLVVCNDSVSPQASFLLGNGPDGAGDGTFELAQNIPLVAKPMQAAIGDFDADGFMDLAISQTGVTGTVSIHRGLGDSFAPPTNIPLYGRSDGIAAGDLDNDGILDLAVCLTDSASTPGHGGILVLRGGGTGGVGDGSFTLGPQLPGVPRFARRVLPVDMDADGILDLLYVGNSPSRNFIRMLPNLTPGCQTISSGVPTGIEPGIGLASGDFDGDGDPDMMAMTGRSLRTYQNQVSGGEGCSFVPNPVQTITLPGSGRDLLSVDYTLDGKLDLVVTLDSVSTVLVYPGAGDCTFGTPLTFGPLDAWGLAVGDFVANGSPDIVVTQRGCGTVTVIEQPSAPLLAIDLELVSPNGGEIWPQAGLPPIPSDLAGTTVPWILEDEATAASPRATLDSPRPPLELAYAQQIRWNKGEGVLGVDVAVSRDGGTSWQTVGANLSGTAMSWIVTPPATGNARVRVSDSYVPSRADMSDATFEMPIATTDVGPGDEIPSVTAFSLNTGNPSRGAMHFRLDLPRSADVDVEVFSASGRLVRAVLRGPVVAGRHDVVWDARDDRGSAAPRGVYFVRARVGSYNVVRKVVVLG